MKCILYLLILFCLINTVSAATIHGSVYDISLSKMRDVIVDINTEPKQQFISKNGTYSFNVPVGDYIIEAKYYTDGLLESSTTEGISVKGDGDFVLDLILFPEIDSGLVDETDDINLDDDYFNGKSDYLLLVVSIVVLIIVIFLVWHYIKRKKPVPQEVIESKDDYYNKILSIIKQNRRVTQKEVRKRIPLSEAKISLIIAELEHKGLIEKIKKGRGNILISKQ